MSGMDEVTIDDRKYVSSKQAAKITGYAKDYVGQLCREGRIPSRLIGRSWYVLESAIQDHRFGKTEEVESKEENHTEESVWQSRRSTWEPAKYHPEEWRIPLISRSNEINEPSEKIEEINDKEEKSLKEETSRVEKISVPIKKEPERLEEGAENPFVDIIPRYPEAPVLHGNPAHSRRANQGGAVGGVLKNLVGSIFLSVALVAILIAVAGSGFMDDFAISHTRFSWIYGIDVSNK